MVGSQAFRYASAFNANIGAWNTAAVSSMHQVCNLLTRTVGFRWRPGLCAAALPRRRAHARMCVRFHRRGARLVGSQAFSYASAFNANIGAWNTAAVSNMAAVCAVLAARSMRHRRVYKCLCVYVFLRAYMPHISTRNLRLLSIGVDRVWSARRRSSTRRCSTRTSPRGMY